MTPQARVKARLAELAEAHGVRITMRARKAAFGTSYYLVASGNDGSVRKFMRETFPTAWVTSGAWYPAGEESEVTYGLPPAQVEKLLAETETDSTWLSWNGSTPLRIARGIREERAFDRLPILADALEEAGCTNPFILGHCRESGSHGQSCWVIELLLAASKPSRRV